MPRPCLSGSDFRGLFGIASYEMMLKLAGCIDWREIRIDEVRFLAW